MKLKIKAKAFIGCLMASLLFSTPLLAGLQLSLAKFSDVNRESLKAYVKNILDRNAYNSILFADVDLLMYKEILYVPLVQNCKEAVCNYDKKKVDAVIDEHTVRATQAVYTYQLETGATKDGFAAWKEKNTCSQCSDYATLLKDSFESMIVVTKGSTRILMINVDAESKITMTFDSAGKMLCVKYKEADAYNKYDVKYIFIDSNTTIKASESTFYGDLPDSTEDLPDSTEDKSVLGGMVTNFEATVTLGHDGNVIEKTGKFYVHNHLLSCRNYQFKLTDDALKSAVNGDYVSIDEL
ncbi:MAG: hypothetical protein QS721_09840 [Candidatus Endonucleobacter sp. (ex Gigantidas childressi)]|nr:hypothetical protein [Candidatus Endonucleobacter sp. (ex Gigantidas childressi)]